MIKLNQHQKNLFCVSLLSLIEGMQLLILTALTLSFLPVPEAAETVLNRLEGDVVINNDMFLYRFFIIATIGVHVINFFRFQKNFREDSAILNINKYIFVEGLLLCGALFAAYEKFMFSSPVWANVLLYFFLAVHIIWISLLRQGTPFVARAGQWILAEQTQRKIRIFIDWAIPVFIICAIFVPDRQGLFSVVYSMDHLNHMDAFVMSPAWAYLKGATLNVDVYSLYGIGLPIFMAKISQLIGGFSYENVITIFLCMIIVYFVLCYFFLRAWLRNVYVAVMGVLLLIKFQMVNYFAYVLVYPSRSVVRYFFDIPFFFLLFLHARDQKKWQLLSAAIISGVALCFITDAGIHLLLGFYAYLFLSLVFPSTRQGLCKSKKDIGVIATCFVLPVIMYLLFLWSVAGQHVFSPFFLANNFGFARIASGGFGAASWFDPLSEGRYCQFFVGCLIPIFYVFTIIVYGAKSMLKKETHAGVFIIALCVYGLSLFHYYVWRALPSNYYVVCVPYILILCYWINKLLGFLDNKKKIYFSMSLVLLSFIALLSTQTFVVRSSILNLANRSLEPNKVFMSIETFAVEDDISLIQKYIKPDEKACLISSFETAMLMQADRAPFFFRFRLVVSHFFNHPDFIGFTLREKDDLQLTIDQLDDDKPEYIFVSKKIFEGKVPPEAAQTHEALPIIMYYVMNYYSPVESGEHLVVLKRNEEEI